MKRGLPVTISTNGLGMPVTPVAKGAPLASVSNNGRGQPIVWSDNGVPLVIEQYPYTLFSKGQPGFWAGGFDPAAGRVYQTSAGDTPTTSFDQPVGLVQPAFGSGDAVQTVSAARPTMARWPRGGRRNLLTWTEDFSAGNWSFQYGTTGSVVYAGVQKIHEGTDQVNGGYGYNVRPSVPAIINVGDTLIMSFEAAADERYILGIHGRQQTRFGNYYINLLTGEMTPGGNNGGISASLLNIELLPDGFCRVEALLTAVFPTSRTGFSLARDDIPFPDGIDYPGDGSSGLLLRCVQQEHGPEVTPYQRVTTANDVTEAGVSTLWHLYNDGVDSLPVALPSDTYGVAWVDPYGAVSFGAETGTAINALPGERVVDSIVRQGAFTPAEEQQLGDYWEGLYK